MNMKNNVESQTSFTTIEGMIKYLIDDEIPEITINNINEYEMLSLEFEILQEEIEKKKKEYGEYLINLNGVQFVDNNKRNFYEEQISEHLDEYIKQYGQEMMRIPIQILYNIFNHPKRKLNLHNEAYENIKKYFEKTGDSNIFTIVLKLLLNNQ